RRPVAAPRWSPARIAASHGCAIEGRVELVLLHREPPAQRLASASAPRPSFDALDHAGCLPEEVRALALTGRDHRQRLERVARFRARTAARLVALQRRE